MPERQKLLDGFKRFQKKYYEDSNCMAQLAKDGAHPDFFIIYCMDPRSGADVIFDSEPGALFGKRPMAAFIPPYDTKKPASNMAASLNYAIKNKAIKHIVVVGHTECGGISALVDHVTDRDINGWVSLARPAYDRACELVGSDDREALCRETEKQAIILSLSNLMTYEAVKQAMDTRQITLNGWLFDITEGALYGYVPDTEKFEKLAENMTEQKQQQAAGQL